MAEIVSKDEFLERRRDFYKKIIDGGVFVMGTDTIYGLFCDATNPAAVIRLRELKSRYEKPLSVIAPSKHWLMQNCVIDEEYLDKLPGPYTFIVKLKNVSCVSFETNNGIESLGVRIPDHWCKDVAKDLDIPLAATSVNRSGKQHMTSLDDMDPYLKKHVDFIVDEGKKETAPSTILDLTKDEVEEIKR